MLRFIWRKIPLSYRGKILGKFKATSLGQRTLKIVKSGVYSPEVLDTGIIFIHVPKVAGTSVVKGLYGINGIGHFTAQEVIKGLGKRRKHYEIIAVARCPWERAVSIFEFVHGGGTSEVPFINSAGFKIPDTFDEFAKDWLPKYSEDELSDVFKSQCHFICDDSNNLLVDKLFFLNDMQRMKKYTESKVSKIIEFPVKNVSARKKGIEYYYRDAETVKAIEHFYARDVEKLGFTRPSVITESLSL
jgi:chondroitin 4-sulfotransferase 11